MGREDEGEGGAGGVEGETQPTEGFGGGSRGAVQGAFTTTRLCLWRITAH